MKEEKGIKWPTALAKEVQVTSLVGARHGGDVARRRSRTGFIIFILITFQS